MKSIGKKLKKTVFVFPVLVVSLTLALMLGSASAQYKMKISNATINDVQHEWQKLMKARLEKRSGGRLKVENYPASQLGNIPTMIKGVQLGTIESYVGPPAFLVGYDERFQVVAAPGLFKDMRHAFRAFTHPKFREVFFSVGEKKGFKGISMVLYGPHSYATRKPFRTLNDFKGKKIRVFASPMQTMAISRLGGTAAPMPLVEVVPALQRGAIDGVRTGITIFTTFKYYDIVKYVTESHDAIILSVGFVNTSWFNRLPKDLQKMILEEGKALEKPMLEWTLDFNEKARKIWKDHGGELIRLSPADQAEMMRRHSTVGADVVKKKPGLKKIYNLLSEVAKETR
jgi:TRAP-type C4-dicarboxylate transport system substrate-binding protein